MGLSSELTMLFDSLPLFSVMFVVSLCLTVFFRRVAQWTGVLDRGGYRRLNEGAVPLLGGLAIALPFTALCVGGGLLGFWVVGSWRELHGWWPGAFSFLYELAQSRTEFLVLGVGSVLIVLLGLLDDVRGLSVRLKLGGQFGVALLVLNFVDYPTGVNVPFGGAVQFGVIGGYIFSVLWIVGIINAFNLIDGMDGLATGIGAISAVTFAYLGALTGNVVLVYLSMAFCGCLCGFLIFNFHPAKIFLGDTGSMLIGFTFAFTTLSQSFRSAGATVLLAPMIALGFPVLETFISMLRRYSHGMPVFMGDNRHTHHRLLARGYSQRQTVLILYVVVAFFSSAAVVDRLLMDRPGLWWVSFILYAAPLVFVLWFADYVAPWVLSNVLKQRHRNKKLGLLSRYGAMHLQVKSDSESCGLLFDLCRHELRLRYLAVWFEHGEDLIAASGAPESEAPDSGFDAVERMRVTNLSREPLVIRYQFVSQPADAERVAVSSCLARMFECSSLEPDEAEVVAIGGSEDKSDSTGGNVVEK